jgi:hypothetical protein
MTDEKEYSQNEVNIMTNEMIALRKEYERAAFRRGAEAMRKAAAAACRPMLAACIPMVSRSELADNIRTLPTPEYTDAP